MRGLYVITGPDGQPVETLLGQVDAALTGGAMMVQYRDKARLPQAREAVALELLQLCRERGACFMINDDVRLAQRINADGVHLGRDDLPLAEARQMLGAGRLIGVSCYADLERARRAEAAGVDYVAFGRFYPSQTKPHAPPAPPSILTAAKAALNVPVVAIGGITAENGRPLVEAGADMLAVIHGVFGQDDVVQAARGLSALF